MKRMLIRVMARGLVVAACAGFAGCAFTGLMEGSPQGPGTARSAAGQRIEPKAALNAVVLGQSTKADVRAALGEPIAVPFDSGYEVWVYRWRGADRSVRASTELVVLFDPSGRASKARLRPGYEERD
jgi:outer membrane protein assembly factor BamE (lipoprotein component of BamABCDE complex)